MRKPRGLVQRPRYYYQFEVYSETSNPGPVLVSLVYMITVQYSPYYAPPYYTYLPIKPRRFMERKTVFYPGSTNMHCLNFPALRTYPNHNHHRNLNPNRAPTSTPQTNPKQTQTELQLTQGQNPAKSPRTILTSTHIN